MKKICLLLTIVSIICLCAFTPSKETNHNKTIAVKKTGPTVTVTYPSNFTRLINLQLKKAVTKANTKSKSLAPYITLYWWDFLGEISQHSDPYWYFLDGDNWPGCTTPTGNLRCEIRAYGNAYNDDIPDLSTITAIKYYY